MILEKITFYVQRLSWSDGLFNWLGLRHAVRLPRPRRRTPGRICAAVAAPMRAIAEVGGRALGSSQRARAVGGAGTRRRALPGEMEALAGRVSVYKRCVDSGDYGADGEGKVCGLTIFVGAARPCWQAASSGTLAFGLDHRDAGLFALRIMRLAKSMVDLLS